MNPLVSILIPSYNAAAWISDSIESALTQTWKNREVIVVDDGSTDNTLAIARRFECQGVKVVGQANQGASAARNNAYKLSQGDYIQWLDADDLLAPDKVAIQTDALRRVGSAQTLLSSAWGFFYYRCNKAKFTPTALWRDLSPVEWLRIHLREGFFMQPGVWLVSRQLAEQAGPWDVRLVKDNDGEYFCRVVAKSDMIHFVPGAKTFYRRPGPTNVSYIGRSNRKLDAVFLSKQLQINYLLALDNSSKSVNACCDLLHHYLAVFYPERPDLVEKAKNLAFDLGRQLEEPRMSWKYAWMKSLFGWSTAKRAELYYNRSKSAMLRSWDKFLFQCQDRPSTARQPTA